MFSHWNLSDSRSPQVARTLLCVLADLNNLLVWMATSRPHISKSSSPFDNSSETVPRVPITIWRNVTFMFHRYLSFISFSFNFTLWPADTAKPTILLLLFTPLLLLFTPLVFFTSVLADGFSLVFEWQQVSSSLQDSSHDSGRSHQCCHLDGLYPSANFQVFQAF